MFSPLVGLSLRQNWIFVLGQLSPVHRVGVWCYHVGCHLWQVSIDLYLIKTDLSFPVEWIVDVYLQIFFCLFDCYKNLLTENYDLQKLWFFCFSINSRNIIFCFNFSHGRKIVLFPSMAIVIGASFITAFAQSFWLFFIIRIVIGFFEGGIALTVFVMGAEMVAPRYRSIAGTIVWLAWTGALCIMTLQAWLVPKWRTLIIILSIPYTVVLCFYA